MLVATRDPIPHSGAQDVPRAGPRGGLARDAGAVTRVARLMTVLQMAGSLLAIPVGLASAYSIYRANFSVETSCQTLRAGIIGMIDKQIDAGTRRMLVGRDVETFEKTCGTVDPEAVAAFKKLLTVEKAPVAAHAAAPAKEAARKVELRPSVAAKPAPVPIPTPAPAAASTPAAATAPTTPTVAAEPAPREAPVSDAKWLAAVRGALVSHAPEHGRTAAAAKPAADPAVTASVRTSAPELAPAPLDAPVSPPVAAAPALPPPTAVVSVPAQPAATDHPVPPAGIPETMAAATAGGGSWVGKIPFVGQMLAR